MNRVVIVTRTKDRPLFLKRALESVTNQIYKDYVHVIVNDGGNKADVDNLIASLDEKQRNKIKVLHRKNPSNAPDTIFNESIDLVKSEFVAIHDDDDTWHPEFLQRTLDILRKGAYGVVARTDRVYEVVGSSGIELKKTIPYMSDMKVINLYRQCIDNQLTPIAFIYRRDVYESIGKYDSTLPVIGDWEFGLRFLRYCDVVYLDPGFALANYHERKNKKDNSFAMHDHRTYFNQVSNKYLREDIQNGSLGLGYIISKLKYDQEERRRILKTLIPRKILKWRSK